MNVHADRPSLPPFNPLDESFRANPYPVYRRYREADPVHWSGGPDHQGAGTWYLFRHADVMAALKDRRLLFLDSRTTAATVGATLAREMGVPHASRDVFLDDTGAAVSVRAKLAETEAIAKRQGFAIAIGHPHEATIEALQVWLPTLAERGFVLVPVSAIVRRNVEVAG